MIGGIAALRFGCTPRAGDLLCCLLTSETLARAGTRGRLVVQEARGPKGWGVTGVVSTALTLTPNRGCTPERNRRISTIPAGRTDAEPVNVSTVDTRPRRSESPWVLRQCPASPSQVRPTDF